MSVRSTYRFARTPEWVLCHPDLNGTDIRVYGILDRYDGKECIPALETIGKRIHCSVNTVRNSLRNLEAVGAIRTEARFVEGRRTSNRYTLAGDNQLVPAPQDSGGSSPQDSGGTTPQEVVGDPEQEDLEQEEPNPPTPQRGELVLVDGHFDLFWAAYPKKVAKPAAKKIFDRLMKTVESDDIMRGLAYWNAYWHARREPEFIPYPSTWLNRHQWEDTPPAVPKNGRKTAPGMDRLREIMEEARNEA